MKIGLFQGGTSGGMFVIQNDNPEADLEELLGGETEMIPLSGRLSLVVRRDAEARQLPIRYCNHDQWRAPQPIAGDCAVVAVGSNGCLRDLRGDELAVARGRIRPVEV